MSGTDVEYSDTCRPTPLMAMSGTDAEYGYGDVYRATPLLRIVRGYAATRIRRSMERVLSESVAGTYPLPRLRNQIQETSCCEMIYKKPICPYKVYQECELLYTVYQECGFLYLISRFLLSHVSMTGTDR
eukprot:1503847-Rhodomonas_salina.1